MKFLSLFVLGVSVASMASAQTPVKSPNCNGRPKFVEVAEGSGEYFDADCKTAFVLPPKVGTVTLASIASNANLNDCDAYKSVQGIEKLAAQQVKDYFQTLSGGNQNDSGNDSSDPFSGGPFGNGGPLGTQQSQKSPGPGGLTDGQVEATNQLIKTLGQLRTLEAPYAGLEGATAQLTFSIDMPKLIQKYQDANPQYKIMRMPFSAARLSFQSKIGDVITMPALLGIAVPGISDFPVAGVTQKGVDGVVAFGDALSGQARLSLAGACSLAQNGKIPSTVSSFDLAAHFASNVQYQYEIQVNRSYHAQYNLAKFAEHIQKQTTSGGFFSTSTANEIIDNKNDSDWFSIQVKSDDSRYANADDLVKDIKADLMDRVLKEVAMNSPENASLALLAPGQNGATAAAKGLRDNCKHIYCQAGAAILDVASAIFGGTSAMSSYISRNNFVSADDVSESKMFTFTGSLSFTPRGN